MRHISREYIPSCLLIRGKYFGVTGHKRDVKVQTHAHSGLCNRSRSTDSDLAGICLNRASRTRSRMRRTRLARRCSCNTCCSSNRPANTNSRESPREVLQDLQHPRMNTIPQKLPMKTVLARPVLSRTLIAVVVTCTVAET